LPVHLYGQLALHEEGMELLKKEVSLDPLWIINKFNKMNLGISMLPAQPYWAARGAERRVCCPG
jgi:hypothetical protein